MYVKAWAVLLLAALSQGAAAHSGGLNAEGCHNNRKTGEYHCHRSRQPPPQAGTAVPQQQFAPAGRKQPSGTGASSYTTESGQTCYIGPRGGTYTITRSGRKNYSGC